MAGARVLGYPFGGPTRLFAAGVIVAPLLGAPLALRQRGLEVQCERGAAGGEGTCSVRSVGLLASQSEEVPVRSILRARMGDERSTERSVLIMTPDSVKVLGMHLAEADAERVVRELNAFVTDKSAARLATHAEDSASLTAFYAAVTSVLLVLGALLWKSAPRVRVELDDDRDHVRVVRETWPLRPRPISVSRADLREAVVEGIPLDAPTRFRVTLVRSDGEREPLTSAYHAGPRSPHDEVALAISTWLRGASG